MIHVVVGGQLGSESKGRVSAHYVRQMAKLTPSTLVCIRVGGPNAGHVVIDDEGRRWAMRQVPVGFVVPWCQLLIAPGSEVDLEVLDREISELEEAGFQIRNRLMVDYSATLLEPRHREQEQSSDLVARVGSTAKGIGAARADRLMRTASTVADAMRARKISSAESFYEEFYRHPQRFNIVIEGTQGYGLGLHTENYPQTTSGDCRAVDFLAQAAISPWLVPPTALRVHVVSRPNPIRVAGNSGALPGETTWQELGLPEERTTVTQNVRRVGAWDPAAVKQALLANGWFPWSTVVDLSLSMLDHLVPEAKGMHNRNTNAYPEHVLVELLEKVRDLRSSVAPIGVRIGLIGTGPNSAVEYKHLAEVVTSAQEVKS